MGIIEIILIAISLAMDSFTVCLCKGTTMKKLNAKALLLAPMYFGIFHVIAPIIGYYAVINFETVFQRFDHWIAFALLVLVGISMIKESSEKEKELDDKLDFKTLTILALAVSIDALAIGVTFAFENVKILYSSLIIGFTAFAFSVLGIVLGYRGADKFGKKAEVGGGLVLIGLGIKILVEHLIYVI